MSATNTNTNAAGEEKDDNNNNNNYYYDDDDMNFGVGSLMKDLLADLAVDEDDADNLLSLEQLENELKNLESLSSTVPPPSSSSAAGMVVNSQAAASAAFAQPHQSLSSSIDTIVAFLRCVKTMCIAFSKKKGVKISVE